jgi:SAM-dependent methyltransferase
MVSDGQIIGFDGRFFRARLKQGASLAVYVDEVLVDAEINHTASMEPGFTNVLIDFNLDPHRAPTPKITIKFAGTDTNVDVAPVAAGFVNQTEFARLDEKGLPAYMTRVQDLRSPPDELVDYIGGGGRSGFLLVGAWTLLNLIYFGMLNGDSRTIVDLGCGCGRAALAIAPYLTDNDRFYGYDTWKAGIDWAMQNITAFYPYMNFEWLQQEDQRGRRGYQAGRAFKLNLPADSVDTVFAMSLFTHLRLEVAAEYLREIYCILKPGGRAYITWLLTRPSDSYVESLGVINETTADGYYSVDDTYVDAYLYEERVFEVIEAAGLKVLYKQYGFWGEKPQTKFSRECQDLLIMSKPAS